ncbi:hypothetical protein G7072_11995 [Nocardioides sp. HDW12B]|uniref:hypothetical protein n=1 Tax=Nocardioides sp. HDW12B TaxID=2714939 RepID=UPI00140AFD3F|nr:hypothetical protein [Nocardioides sp. HDW12B]QIK66966.1 hypothetical protein G7072_11995 [Nocardioides sp. HDW12B]
MESTLSFDGRVYDGVGSRFERPWRELRVGRRVGTGEMPTCRSSPRRVGVSAVVGCDVRDVVLVPSEEVLMVREDLVAEAYGRSGLDRVCR